MKTPDRPFIVALIVSLLAAASPAPAQDAPDAPEADAAAPTTQPAEPTKRAKQEKRPRIDHLAAEEPAEMLPGTTGAFVQVNDLSQWRSQLTEDPLLRSLVAMMPGSHDKFAWLGLQQALGLGGDDIIDGYCGRRVVLAGISPGKGKGASLILRVSPERSQLVVQRLSLEPIESAGAFRMYSTRDNQTRIAVHERWVALTPRSHEPDMRRLLLGGSSGQVLARNPQFASWTARLPEQPRVIAYFAGQTSGHAAALTDSNEAVSLHYIGRPRYSDIWLDNLGEEAEPQWPPLPADAAAALCVNVKHGLVKDEGIDNPEIKAAIAMYNRDVVANVASPFVIVAGHVDLPVSTASETKAPWPAVAVLIRFADREQTAQYAGNLSHTIDALVSAISFYDNLGPDIAPRSEKHRNTIYTLADLGEIISVRYRRSDIGPGLKNVRLTYGPVGSWYVIATHDAFFKSFIDANADPDLRLDPARFACKKLNKPCGRAVATAFIRTDQIADRIQTWVDYWQKHHPEVVELADFTPNDAESRIAKQLLAAQAFCRHASRISARFHKDTDENLILGRIDLQRRETETAE